MSPCYVESGRCRWIHLAGFRCVLRVLAIVYLIAGDKVWVTKTIIVDEGGGAEPGLTRRRASADNFSRSRRAAAFGLGAFLSRGSAAVRVGGPPAR